ncbi:hypothetical protein DES47_11567 [Roseateles toxinivorans]|uniref:DUF3631 domain-containing protein n=2 Tax=Roseateles toxinivorans TaxID=270368 RepID=A0A4R6QE27_9BURK|nr:hypothetical protein DES47_11567 [Roseateles toxinivorans]
MRADHGLIRHRVVLLPSAADEYSDIADLAVTVRSYIRRYVTLTETFTDIAVYYVLLTWVYDRFNELPYLRFKGDFGSGKTRALTVVGSITYKPIFASGASTVSPIFHTLDLFRGTLIFDEADFRFSDERAELTKIFNNGTVRGFPVLRTNMSDKREFDPRAFDVFGPKLVGMREIFQDYALESRFITEEMRGTVDENVPINLPESQKDEALVLRNKLLMYRFREHANIVVNPALADKGLSSRANQILVPLLSIIPDPDMHERIKSLVHAQSEELIRDRSTQLEALVLQVIIQLGEKDNEATYVPLAVVRQAVLLQHGSEFDRPLTARFLGSLIRNRLRLRSYRSSVYMVEVPKGEILAGLERRYGLSHAVPGK